MKPYYEHAGITIYHGDCRDILPQLPKVDLVLTDPPYGIKEARGKNKTRGKVVSFSSKGRRLGGSVVLAQDFGYSDWDDAPPSPGTICDVRYAAKWAIIFGGNFFTLPPSRCWLVWDKDNGGSDFADCELAWTNLDKAVRKIRYRWNGMLQEKMGDEKETRFHPTQKPLDVMKWCIRQAPDDCRTILDPFMGSGTTLRAAKDLGRLAIGIDAEEKYCEIAARRLQQEVFAL